MPANSLRAFLKILLLTAAMAAAAGAAAAADVASNPREAGGMTIYLGVLPAEIVREAHVDEHEERRMHGDVPAGRNRYHVVVALFDAASGSRIEDAKVEASVGELGLGLQWKVLEPMHIADTLSYGNYYTLPRKGTYSVNLRIRRPGQASVVETTMVGQHFGAE